jgi:hypothetical protein
LARSVGPLETAAEALAKGVVDAMRADDLVAARACAEALRTLVGELGRQPSGGATETRRDAVNLSQGRQRREEVG